MASNKTLLKNGKLEVIYKFVNDSPTPVTFTVTMAELLRADQQIVGTAGAYISSINYCSAEGIKITRNSTLDWFLIGDNEFDNGFTPDRTDSTSTINIEIASGTMVIKLIKNDAFKDL